jgi:hypothetical protein
MKPSVSEPDLANKFAEGSVDITVMKALRKGFHALLFKKGL